MHTAEIALQAEEEPRVLETYSVVYALVLVFLLPAMAFMVRLPFGDARSTTYTFEYVSLVTLPFVLGVALTFLLDSREGLKRGLLRVAVLTPLVVVTGVTFMFAFSLLMLPASKFLGIRDQGLSIAWWVGLALVAAPLVLTLPSKISRRAGKRGILQAVAIVLALALVLGLTIFSFFVDANVYELVRKDVVIYIVGALTWYLPAFGLAAGLWRRSGLV